MTMQTLSFTLNVTGLLADILGAVLLFYTRMNHIPTDRTYGILAHAMGSEIRDLVNAIAKVNQENDKIHNQSNKWLWLLVAGFLLQLCSSIVSYCGSSSI